jgi:hypothetical protein
MPGLSLMNHTKLENKKDTLLLVVINPYGCNTNTRGEPNLRLSYMKLQARIREP